MLADAYRHALLFAGKIVALVGVTMAAGMVTWTWLPIEFQADMEHSAHLHVPLEHDRRTDPASGVAAFPLEEDGEITESSKRPLTNSVTRH